MLMPSTNDYDTASSIDVCPDASHLGKINRRPQRQPPAIPIDTAIPSTFSSSTSTIGFEQMKPDCMNFVWNSNFSLDRISYSIFTCSAIIGIPEWTRWIFSESVFVVVSNKKNLTNDVHANVCLDVFLDSNSKTYSRISTSSRSVKIFWKDDFRIRISLPFYGVSFCTVYHAIHLNGTRFLKCHEKNMKLLSINTESIPTKSRMTMVMPKFWTIRYPKKKM